jgi:phage terminase small subunit
MTTTSVRQRLTGKQERFALLLFQGVKQHQAYIQAGYSSNQAPATIDRHAFDLANDGNVLARLGELQQKAEDATIGTVIERKQRLTEIYRANLTDFVDDEGNITLKPSAAIAEYTTTEQTVSTGDGEVKVITKKTIKLHAPVPSIQEHNRMERIGNDQPAGINVNIDNRKVEAQIVHIDSREVARTVLEAMRLGLSPAMVEGNGHSEDATVLSSPADIQAASLPQSKN